MYKQPSVTNKAASLNKDAFNESNTIQAGLVSWLSEVDWTKIEPQNLDRDLKDVFLEKDVVEALAKFNPIIKDDTKRADEIMYILRALLLTSNSEGLVKGNQRMWEWLVGNKTHHFQGRPAKEFLPVNFFDFESVENNNFVVSHEVKYEDGIRNVRFDIVLYVNGFPLVVGETKTPVHGKISWLDGAKDVESYRNNARMFFVPNLLTFSSEGREFRYGSVTQTGDSWLTWGSTTDNISPSLKRVKRDAKAMLAPKNTMLMLKDYVLFLNQNKGKKTVLSKLLPRYSQVEATEAIVARVKDKNKRQGLVAQYQGAGKTFVMAYAASKIYHDKELKAPTVIAVFDSLDLIEQTYSEFQAAGISDISVAKTRKELKKLLQAEDRRGIIMTTIFRFAELETHTSTRYNIAVMCDEAHRTQEGSLAQQMRKALPNATFIGLTGTPISTNDKDTFENFGHKDDPGYLLNQYTMDKSIEDGATLPIHLEARLVDFHIQQDQLDQAFNQMAEDEGLDDEQKELLASRASRIETIMKSPKRLEAVSEDAMKQWIDKHMPLGQSGMFVAQNRELCMAYFPIMKRLLAKQGKECTVIMTCDSKNDPEEWQEFNRGRAEEKKIKDRIKDPEDDLKIVIVTAKLLTGFNAPNLGVIFFDRAIRGHTLFQAATRVNRPWVNPITSQSKIIGKVVDYVGIGSELTRAMQAKPGSGKKKAPITNHDELVDQFEETLNDTLKRFKDVDLDADSFEILMQAQQALETEEEQTLFAEQFVSLEYLFEFLWPDTSLLKHRKNYKFLAGIYQSLKPTVNEAALLWHQYGAKTQALVTEHINEVKVSSEATSETIIDDETAKKIRQLGLMNVSDPIPTTVEDVLQGLDQKLQKLKDDAKEEKETVQYEKLSEKLQRLKEAQLQGAKENINFLQEMLVLAKQITDIEREKEDDVVLVDKDKQALTQIFQEYKPDFAPQILERIVDEIDKIVKSTRFSGWQESTAGDRSVRKELRQLLHKNNLAKETGLFEKAYIYIKANY